MMENKKSNLLSPVPILATSASADYDIQKLLLQIYTTLFYANNIFKIMNNKNNTTPTGLHIYNDGSGMKCCSTPSESHDEDLMGEGYKHLNPLGSSSFYTKTIGGFGV